MERIAISLTDWSGAGILAHEHQQSLTSSWFGRFEGLHMAKGSTTGKSVRGKRSLKAHKDGDASSSFEGMKWRVDRLERQIRRLSELVREHAADADRLVQIVAENRELLRQELMAKGSPTARHKKSDRDMNGKLDVLP